MTLETRQRRTDNSDLLSPTLTQLSPAQNLTISSKNERSETSKTSSSPRCDHNTLTLDAPVDRVDPAPDAQLPAPAGGPESESVGTAAAALIASRPVPGSPGPAVPARSKKPAADRKSVV